MHDLDNRGATPWVEIDRLILWLVYSGYTCPYEIGERCFLGADLTIQSCERLHDYGFIVYPVKRLQTGETYAKLTRQGWEYLADADWTDRHHLQAAYLDTGVDTQPHDLQLAPIHPPIDTITHNGDTMVVEPGTAAEDGRWIKLK